MSVHPQICDPSKPAFVAGYLESLALVERLHRLLLDVIKDEFERVGILEINAVQALLLFNIGIEVGQLMIVAVIVVLSRLAMRFFSLQHLIRAGAWGMGCMAAFWTIDRTLLLI